MILKRLIRDANFKLVEKFMTDWQKDVILKLINEKTFLQKEVEHFKRKKKLKLINDKKIV